jgi:hypothetical protein
MGKIRGVGLPQQKEFGGQNIFAWRVTKGIGSHTLRNRVINRLRTGSGTASAIVRGAISNDWCEGRRAPAEPDVWGNACRELTPC